jgi:pantothenate kinase
MTSRAGMPPIVDEPVPALAERARALAERGGRTILGLAGPPGAGKSTLASALGAALSDCAVVVGMDGFHLANAELRRLDRLERKGAPDTFDSYGYAALLVRLRANTEPVVYAPVFDRTVDESVGSAVPVSRDVPLVITEGNYLLLDRDGWSTARQCIDQVWFLEVPDEIRLHRLARRHMQFGLAPEPALERASGTDGNNATIVLGTRARADLLIRVAG